MAPARIRASSTRKFTVRALSAREVGAHKEVSGTPEEERGAYRAERSAHGEGREAHREERTPQEEEHGVHSEATQAQSPGAHHKPPPVDFGTESGLVLPLPLLDSRVQPFHLPVVYLFPAPPVVTSSSTTSRNPEAFLLCNPSGRLGQTGDGVSVLCPPPSERLACLSSAPLNTVELKSGPATSVRGGLGASPSEGETVTCGATGELWTPSLSRSETPLHSPGELDPSLSPSETPLPPPGEVTPSLSPSEAPLPSSGEVTPSLSPSETPLPPSGEVNRSLSRANVGPFLRCTLAKALSLYPPLAGRLVVLHRSVLGETRYGIRCNNQGVTFVEVEVHESMEQALGPGMTQPPLLPRGLVSTPLGLPPFLRCPLLTVQLTRFSCGGITVGVTFHHWVTDGAGFFQFMSDWAAIARSIDPASVLNGSPCPGKTVIESCIAALSSRGLKVKQQGPAGNGIETAESARGTGASKGAGTDGEVARDKGGQARSKGGPAGGAVGGDGGSRGDAAGALPPAPCHKRHLLLQRERPQGVFKPKAKAARFFSSPGVRKAQTYARIVMMFPVCAPCSHAVFHLTANELKTLKATIMGSSAPKHVHQDDTSPKPNLGRLGKKLDEQDDRTLESAAADSETQHIGTLDLEHPSVPEQGARPEVPLNPSTQGHSVPQGLPDASGDPTLAASMLLDSWTPGSGSGRRKGLRSLDERASGTGSEVEPEGWVSTDDVLCALLWKAVTLARGLEKSPDAEVCFQRIVNARTRLSPPLPPRYFGNVVFLQPQGHMRFSAAELLQMRTSTLAAILRQDVNRVDESRCREFCTMQPVQLLTDDVLVPKPGHGTFVTSWRNFNIYDFDFGLGIPENVSQVFGESAIKFLFNGMILTQPSHPTKSPGGVDIGIHLPNDHMQSLKLLMPTIQRLLQ